MNARGAPVPAGPVLLAAVLGLAVWAAGCGTAGEMLRLPGASSGGVEAWRIPETAFPSQRLYRVDYEGPEGKASFRLTLYLPDPRSYRMEASDSLGRRAWSLALEADGRALWLDHRDRLFCRARGVGEQAFVPLAHLPLAALPRLVLGLMPAEPADDLRRADDGRLSYRDARGRLWSGGVEDGRLAWWTLAEGGEAVAWWRRLERDAVFSDRRGGQQVRWREQVAEPLARALDPLDPPAGYREGACGEHVSALAGR